MSYFHVAGLNMSAQGCFGSSGHYLGAALDVNAQVLTLAKTRATQLENLSFDVVNQCQKLSTIIGSGDEEACASAADELMQFADKLRKSTDPSAAAKLIEGSDRVLKNFGDPSILTKGATLDDLRAEIAKSINTTVSVGVPLAAIFGLFALVLILKK